MPTDYLATDTEFTDVADAIRAKGGTSAALSWPTGFISAINAIPTGGTLQSKIVSYTPTESAQSDTVTADSGYDGLSSVYVDVSAIPSSYVGSGVARRSSSDLTASGATVSVPAGYYESAASKAVASGTAGTPTATKGTVSNHAVTVTPSVTNTAGYISGGVKTGTGVSVAASELVSGSETKTANGTYDVTNLSELVVNVPSGIGTLLATQSLGSLNISSTSATNLNKSVTVPNAGNYDLLIVDTSRDGATATANYHRSTVRPIYLWGTPSTPARTSSFLVGAISFKYDNHAASTASNASNTGYGIYPNSVSLSNGTATLALYGRYNSTYSGTINGNYTTRVYGVNLYDLIGG